MADGADQAPELSLVLRSVRDDVIRRWAGRVTQALGTAPLPAVELMDHMPEFVDALVRKAASPDSIEPRASASQHGSQRLRLGFDVGEVVREYGVLHECLIEAVADAGYPISPPEQCLVARAMSEGIADAVSQYVEQRDAELERQASEHLSFIAHEVRNGLASAMLTYQALRASSGVPDGALERLGRNLGSIAQVVDNELMQSWLRMGVEPAAQSVPIRPFLDELVADLRANARERRLEPQLALAEDLTISADPRLLRSAVSNLVTNALKFSPPGSTVTVRGWASEGRLLIEVADQCGGLPPGKAEELFSPLVQKHGDRSGFGLGLAIVRQAAEAHGGTVKVRDLPGVGCVFSLDLPLVPDLAAPAHR